jgi:hypothetical protein
MTLSSVRRTEERSKALRELQALARRRGGLCLSKYYVNVKAPLTWQCAVGHRWRSSSEGILRGSWCLTCYLGELPNLEQMRRLAEKRGGACVSTRYDNDRRKLRWRCREGHHWFASPNSIKAGTWCPRCARDGKIGAPKPVYTIEDMRDLAASKQGECLSTEYKGVHSALLWRCSQGHEWETRPQLVRRGGWCPDCARERRKRRNVFALKSSPPGARPSFVSREPEAARWWR